MLKSLKNISLGLATLSLIASLSACTKQRIYLFDEENVHYDWTVLATNDSANERFVLDIKKNNEKSKSSFGFFFIFRYGNAQFIKNTDDTRQLVYRLYDGEEIQFDEDGFYYFDTSNYINVFYTYADQEVKQAIADKDYDIQFGCGSYHPK